MRTRFLVAALIINASLGVIYTWSLFVLPLEQLLLIGRTKIGVVASVSLTCLTIGLYLHDTVIRRLTLSVTAPSVLLGAAMGHVLFFLWPSFYGLLLGYGIMFGLSVGVGFGLALALARVVLVPTNAAIVGCVSAVFALSGMVLSSVLAWAVASFSVSGVFGGIGGLLVFAGLVVTIVLWRSSYPYEVQAARVDVSNELHGLTFWFMLLGNFSICYVGLMFVSHGGAMFVADYGDPTLAPWAPTALNSGYVLGALTGGLVATRFPSRLTPLATCCLCLSAVVIFQMPVAIVLKMACLFFVGVAFGSTVSVFMMLLSLWYGRDKGGELFGRLGIGYGAAGICAPFFSGWLYTRNDNYDSAFTVGGIALVGGAVALALMRKPIHADAEV